MAMPAVGKLAPKKDHRFGSPMAKIQNPAVSREMHQDSALASGDSFTPSQRQVRVKFVFRRFSAEWSGAFRNFSRQFGQSFDVAAQSSPYHARQFLGWKESQPLRAQFNRRKVGGRRGQFPAQLVHVRRVNVSQKAKGKVQLLHARPTYAMRAQLRAEAVLHGAQGDLDFIRSFDGHKQPVCLLICHNPQNIPQSRLPSTPVLRSYACGNV